MQLIIITDTPFSASEPALIRLLFSEGAGRIHLRKPQATETEMRQLIESLPTVLYPRLTLQDHLPLANEYGIGGVHLNARNTKIPNGFRGLVSHSCHSFNEIAAHPAEDYLFLSPVFDSISKNGYRSAFTPEQLSEASARKIIGRRVIALGGIRPEHLPGLRENGFGGVALLGYIWQNASPGGLIEKMKTIRKFNTL